MSDRHARPLPKCRWLVYFVLLGLGLWANGSIPSAAASKLRKTPIVEAVKKAGPSVVNIRGEKTVANQVSQFADSDVGRRVNGMGTGVVIDPRGYIVTNHHVVEGVREIQVTLATGDQHTAQLVAHDTETDLAIIKINTDETLEVITTGTSNDLMPGEPVIAVGNAYGYEHTVTRGIISALHRAVQVSDAQFYEDLIQTDASINPGNSGGPLLNIDGEMIGINVAVRAGAQGIGFAIPVDKALEVAADLLARHNQRRAWHGVELDTAAADDDGLKIDAVQKESPAAEAGLEPGDLVSGIGDVTIKSLLDFQRAILEQKAGDEVELLVKRDDETLNVSLTLADVPLKTQTASSMSWQLLGLDLETIPAEQFHRRFQTRYRGGLSVSSVRPNSAAAQQGIRSGDVLVGMHIWETVSLENVNYILNHPDFAQQSPVKFFILRGNETLYGYLPVSVPKTAQR
jgi:serine protease Do